MKIDQIINEMTSSGAVASVSMPLGATQKRAKESVDVKGLKPVSKLKNAKKKGPYANSIVENKEQVKVSEAELQEDDLIIIPGRGPKRKNGFVPKGQSRVDHEVEMARSDVLATMKNAKSIYHMLKDRSEEEGIEGWVQEKLIKANDYLNAVKEYYDEQMMQEMNGGVIAAGGVGEGVAEGSVWSSADQKMKHYSEFPHTHSAANDIRSSMSGKVIVTKGARLSALGNDNYLNLDTGVQPIKLDPAGVVKQGVAEAKSPQEFMSQITKVDPSILDKKKDSPYYMAGKMLSKYADKIGQDSMDFSDFKQHAALLMGGPEDNMRSAKQVRNLDTAARDIILDMIWEYSSTQKDADTYYKISGFKRLRESTKSTRAGVAEGQLNEKFKSQQQAKLMYAVAGNKDVSKKTGVSQKVAKEFIKKSHDQKVSQLPKKVKKTTEEIQTGGSKGLPFPGTYEQETNKFKYKGQRRTPTL